MTRSGDADPEDRGEKSSGPSEIGAKTQLIGACQQAVSRQACSTLRMENCCKNAAPAPHCFACRIERISIDVAPIAGLYDVRSLECPSCKSLVRLVELRRSSALRRKWRRSPSRIAPAARTVH